LSTWYVCMWVHFGQDRSAPMFMNDRS